MEKLSYKVLLIKNGIKPFGPLWKEMVKRGSLKGKKEKEYGKRKNHIEEEKGKSQKEPGGNN